VDGACGDVLSMKTDNPIKLGVNDALKDAQFQRKSNTWYRDTDETIVLVNVQKSNFGEQYYINLSVWVKGLPGDPCVRLPSQAVLCHIEGRLGGLMPGEDERLRQMLNVEDESLEKDQRRHAIEDVITRIVLPFLLQCSTRAGIREAYGQGRLRCFAVKQSVLDCIRE